MDGLTMLCRLSNCSYRSFEQSHSLGRMKKCHFDDIDVPDQNKPAFHQVALVYHWISPMRTESERNTAHTSVYHPRRTAMPKRDIHSNIRLSPQIITLHLSSFVAVLSHFPSFNILSDDVLGYLLARVPDEFDPHQIPSRD